MRSLALALPLLLTLAACGRPQDLLCPGSGRSTKTGVFAATAGAEFRVVVIADTVRSVVYVASGDPAPFPLGSFLTITGFYDFALTEDAAGLLRDAQVDPSLRYLTRLEILGPPDAGGTIVVSNLRPLP